MTNSISRRTMLKGMAGIVGLSAAAACAPTAPPATGTSSTTTSATPKRGGIIRVLYQAEPPHLDPTLETSYATHGGPGAPYSRLIRYKVGPNSPFESRDLEPDLALSWEQPDPVTYIFKLRPGVKWHNKAPVNGRAFTADDVKFSYEFYKDPANKTVFQSIFNVVQRVDVVDPLTVRITLTQPLAFFLDNVASNHYSKILPREVFEKEGSFKNTVIGTGPFIFDRWERGVKMVFSRNPEYWEQGRPYVDGFEWIIQGDYATRIAILRSGEVDYGPEPTGPQGEDVEDLKKQRTDLIWDKQIRANLYWLAVNNTRKPFDDPRVRQAVSLALDRPDIVKSVFLGDGVIDSHMPSALKEWHMPEADRQAFYGKRDLNRAKQLLAAAGYPNGFEAEFLPRETSGNEFALAEVLVSMLKDVGITARMKPVTRPEWTAALSGKTYQIAQGLGQTSFEPDDWTYVLYHSKAPRNWWGNNDPQLDALLDKQRAETNVVERKKLMVDIQKMLTDQMPLIPVAYRYENMPRYPHLKNFKTHWSYNMTYFTEAWLDK